MCGGTSLPVCAPMGGRGLSPRVRGNPVLVPLDQQHPGSIPACAGEPQVGDLGVEAGKVYPRVCGGTWLAAVSIVTVGGLSPRVRGNRVDFRRGGRRRGSIPACAGEPWPGCELRPERKVYPRVCGGTWHSIDPLQAAKGLSPRVRGNLSLHGIVHHLLRSIPACAGEPTGPPSISYLPAVYPRVCGGTASLLVSNQSTVGLSPRVRGNPKGACGTSVRKGSIPACAGEPVATRIGRAPRRVYPRVCGGTQGGVVA